MRETPYRVMITNDYDMFKRLKGNRSIPEARVRKVMNSINSVGYVMDPILVNEKYEVIDGQGRLEALRRLEMPVYYIQESGIGREECISMNINQTNWTMLDYVYSYAEMGIESYQYLLRLLETYGKNFKFQVIRYALTGKIDCNSKAIKEGRFQCTREGYDIAKEILAWSMKFIPIFSKIPGHTEYYYMALMFCYSDQEVDNERLYDKLYILQANLIPIATIQQALEQIEEIYNNRLKQKVYIKTNYRKYLDNKYGWYEERYGNKY